MKETMPIPTEYLHLYVNKQVHVAGWNKACTFVYEGTVNGFHELRTPKTGKHYRTRNALLYTRRYQSGIRGVYQGR